ncbi:MAG: hypothetical protein JST61_00940 [Acidobacteria bacterium]|nr:hypothetical protein [Acidobacteriota bacterium]
MMCRALSVGLLLSLATAMGQMRAGPAADPADDQPPAVPAARTLLPKPAGPADGGSDLPDAPSTTGAQQDNVVAVAKAALKETGRDREPCNLVAALGLIYFDPNRVDTPRPRCSELVYPYQRFLSTNVAIPLNWKQKGYLAAHYTTDPASLGTIAGISAINIAADPDTAYGPGMKGFGKLAGISILQNATAEFFGTFAVPALTHQDPRYYRMPGRPLGKRILYSVSRTIISRDDGGKTVPNYGTLAAYPIVAELSNLYVPGIGSDGASTVKRIATGFALDPVNNLVNEFLPDVARHVHIRVIFAQQILNNIAATQGGLP